MPPRILRTHQDGVTIQLHAKTKAKSDSIVGVHGDALRVSVSAVPQKGEANEAIRKLLSRAFGLPVSLIVIVSGQSSQDKVALFRGVDAATIQTKLDAILVSTPLRSRNVGVKIASRETSRGTDRRQSKSKRGTS